MPFAPPISLDDDRLVLWLDASEPSTVTMELGRVRMWRDRSRWHNDMTAKYAAGPDAMPSQSPPPITIETLENGRRAIRFWHDSIKSYDRTSIIGGAFEREVSVDDPDWLVLAVAKHTNATDGVLFAAIGQSSRSPTPCLFAGAAALGTAGFALQNAKRVWNDGALHAYAFVVDGRHGSFQLFVDGTVTTLSSYATDFRNAGKLTVGGIHHDQHCGEGCSFMGTYLEAPLEGAIAEVMVFRAASGTSADIQFLRNYVHEKYGLSL